MRQILEIHDSILVSEDHIGNARFVSVVGELELVREFVVLKMIPDLTDEEARLLDELRNVHLQILTVKPFDYGHLRNLLLLSKRFLIMFESFVDVITVLEEVTLQLGHRNL